ncbi:MAG: DUF2341 domain-containing protein, partial [Deltaproteobacteria bacterium]|nr:DUF2341 domain-containing protein [Deltaproteobacteria bacterium]
MKSGGYSFIGRLLTVLIPTVIFLVLIFAAQTAGAAFPTVVGSSNSEQASNNPPTISLPAGIVAGDLIIVFLAQDETATATWPSPWVELVDENAGTAANLHVAYLIASGGETTVAPTMSADERSQHLAIRISAASWDGITPPEVSTPLTGASGTPDSGSLTPSWGSEDTLWITTFGMDGPDVRFPVTVWPTNYADNNLSNGTGDLSTAGIALATRNLATATEDPGAFTTTGSDDWVASTIAVRPAGPSTYSTPVSSVSPGWSNNRNHVVFYNGSRFFLLYSKGDGLIYYKSSPDNVTWSGESTLAGITGANTGLFDIYLVNDAKFDLVYWRSTDQNRYVNTCTISGATITCGASPVGINGTISKVAVARSGAGNRIYVVATNGSDLWVAAANNTGDAANVTAWPSEVNVSNVDPTAVAIVPYQGSDEVLVVYTKNLGGSGSDGVYSRVITSGGGAGTEEEVNVNFDSLPDFSSPVRISDTDFRIIIKPPGASLLQEYQWNDVSWSSVETVDTETDQETPSLFYDRISGDMYAFSVDTSSDDVERHYKPNGGSWQAEVIADDGEATAHSYPITQMHESPLGSARVDQRELVWAYRVVNGADYDLKVGNLNIAQASRCWSSELLTNPGFETGDATGWTNGGGGSVDIGAQCTWCNDGPHSGSYQAYWESTAAGYYLYQTVDLSSYASNIDAGNAVISATGWLISNEYQASPPYDEFYMQVIFYDGGSSEIVAHTYDTGAVNNANWGQYGPMDYTIPSGARSVEVRFYTWETDGTWYDAGSADDFSVTVGTPCAAGQYDQDSFRARNDNGDETTSTWTAAANTNWTQMVDKNFRVRFLVQETSGIADSGKTFQLEYNLNGGGWNDVTGSSSVVKATATANVTDGANTTQQLGSGTYVPTNAGFDEANGQVGSMDFAGSDEVEVEFSLQIVGTDVSNSDTIQLRVNGLDTYTNTPTVTVTGAGTFSYKKSIEIQEAEVTCTSNVSNFPAMVQLTGADFLEIEDDVDADGYDIIFKAEDDATCGGTGMAPCILDHEIEVYDETNDLLVAWVRIPSLDYNNNTTIYLYYGNATVDAPTENPAGVWDSGYAAVWHLKEAVTDEGNLTDIHVDSTNNNNDGDQHGNDDLSGRIGTGQDFDTVDDYIEGTSNGFSTQAGTIDFWIKPNWNGNDNAEHALYIHQETDWDTNAIWIKKENDNTLRFWVADASASDYRLKYTDISGWIANEWHHITVSWDPSLTLKMYLDGGEITPTSYDQGTPGLPSALGATFTLGGYSGVGGELDGILDEVRISNVDRDACWIETEHSNQNTPASFYIVGSQQTTAANVYSFRKPLTIDSAQVGTSCTSTTDTWQISANDRDAWDDTSSGSLNSSIFGDSQWSDAGGYQWAVNIPQGATITSAKVRVYPTSHGGSTTSSYTARIRVEDTDNASAFTGAPNDIYTRTYWGTTIDWTIPAAGLPINTWSESPDITGLIQHIVNKGTWSPGNYLSIAIWGETVNGTGCNEGVTDYNTNASLAAQLEVTYQTGSGSIQDFPVMVKLTGTDFQEVEDNVDADGYDIIFKAEDDTTCGGVGLAPCTLDHEIEVYDETNDLLVAWVRVPEVPATADTNIYMYYGNPAISSPTENTTGVWDPDYVSVWHLHDDFDDSAGSNNGTNYGSTNITGQIGDGQDFDGTDDYATMPTTGFSTSAGTVEAWINIDSFPSSGPEYVFAHRQASPTTDRVYVQLWDDTTWGTGMGDTYDLVRGSTLNIDTWYHLVITWDGTNVRGYRNGSLDFGPTSYVGLNTVREISIMAWDPSTEWADGTLDELRVSSTARSACWIETEHSNQKASSILVSVGGEEPSGEAILADHAAGQETDKFSTGSSVTGAELFAFQLTNTTGSTVTFNQVQFQLSSVTGIADTDFANLAIYVDDNGDGTIDGSDTTGAVGGAGAVDGSVTTITFNTPFNISAVSTVSYILRGDVSNLVATDTVTMGLGTSNITLATGSVGGTSPTSVSHTTDSTGDYAYRQPITIYSSMVGSSCSSALPDFPVLVRTDVPEIFSNSSSLTIPDSGQASLYPSNITVSGVTGTVTKVTVSVYGLNHTWADDIDMLLVGPGGQTVMLMSDQGNDDAISLNLTFDDDAPSDLPDATTASSGTYKPIVTAQNDAMNGPAPAGPYGTLLSDFNGVDPNGTWSLYIMDDAANDAGSLSGGWELAITTETVLKDHVTHASGYDIIFKAEDDTTCGGAGLAPCTLDHEIEKYESSTGELVAWVRIPSLSDSADTTIYMYYGNPAISSPTENPAGVWDTNYKGVWHLHDDFINSVDNISATESGSINAIGQIADGQNFNDTTDTAYTTVSGLPAGNSPRTLSAWFNPTSDALLENGAFVGYPYNGYLGSDLRWFELTYSNIDVGDPAGYRKFVLHLYNTNYVSTNTFAPNNWYHISATYVGTSLKVYVNNSLEINETVSLNTAVNPSGFNFNIGTEVNQAVDTLRDGVIDEVRIASIARDACWIETEYNNQGSPFTFYSVGSEETTTDAMLADHAAGQETDKFGAGSSVTGAELFAFKLTNTTGGTLTVNQVQFQLSLVTGISDTDFANLEIQVDDNGDGTIDGSDTTGAVGGIGAVDGSVTTITFSTPFDISTSATVNYILRGDVSNLVTNDTVTIDLGTGNITLASGTVGGSAVSSVSHTSTDDVNLADHGAGQESDIFGAGSSVTGAELFAFQLSNTTGSTLTVNQVQFQLSSVTGILDTDFANLEIQVDDNGDGTIDGSDTTGAVGGTGAVDGSVTTITFSTPFNISAVSTVNYILRGDVNNLVANDTVTIDLGTGNITLASGTVGGTAATSVTHTADATPPPIILDNTSGGSTNSGTNTLTFQHTIGCGSNRLLVVSIAVEGSVTYDVTDVTYNGVSLTKGVENAAGSAFYINTEIWYMLDAALPSAGTYDVVITTTGDPTETNINAGAISVTGVAQGLPEATAVNDDAEAGSATIQTDITTSTDGAWIFDCVGSGQPRNFTPFDGRTEFFDVMGASSGGAGTYEEKATAGLETQRWDVDGTSNRISHVLLAFAPAVDTVAANLSQTHYRWRYDDGGEGGAVNWWDSNYLYRQKVTFGTSHSILPLGYTAAVTMDTQTATTNVALTSGNDVRVIWQPTAGGYQELDRIGDTWDNASTTIEFRLQSEIDANLDEDVDGSYYIYYGYGTAGTPPTDERNVYYFADFFDRADNTDVNINSTQNWTEWITGGGDSSIVAGALNSVGNNVGPPDAGVKQTFPLGAVPGNFTLTFDWTIPSNTESTWTHYLNIGNSATMVDGDRELGVGPGIYTGEGTHFNPNLVENVNNDLNDTTIMEQPVNGGPHSIRMDVDVSAYTYDYYRNGSPIASGQAFVNNENTLDQIRFANDQYSGGQPAFICDNLKIVLNVANVPEEALGIEESSSSGASFAELEDTKLTGLVIDTNIRLRFQVSNEGGQPSDPTVTYQLQVAETATCGSGTYTAVPTDNSGHWQIMDSSYITEPQATSDIPSGLSDPVGGTFVPGEVKEVGNTTGSIPLDACEYTEVEFVLRATEYATYSGDYCFQLYDTTNGKTLNYSKYGDVSLADGIFSYRKPITFPAANLGASCSPNQVSATAPDTTTSAAYVLVDSMTITPGAGDYVVWFSGTLENSATGTQHVSLFLDGSQITHTEREITTESSIPGTPFVVATHAYISGVTGGQAIEVHWKTDAPTATMLERTLVVTKVSATDVMQVSEIPTNLATTTSATYEQINTMTITPGAGDYLIWFSGSIMNTASPSVQHVSLFVNGSQLAHTEREIDQEESLTTTYFPVATHALKASVGDNEAIAVYWKRDTGTATMKARTLTVYKINAANSLEESATLDDTTTSASYTPVDSMSITPGAAGNYHIWFSSSLVDPQATDTINVSLFVGGTQVLHTEREIWVEGSLDNPYQTFPVALHAYVEGVGASDVIDVRWKRTGSGTVTMHERTLVVAKVGTALSDFPALISITDTDLRDKARSDGNDIIFRWDDGTCGGEPCKGLDHEIEEWNSSTGKLIAWVRIPKVSSSNDTTIYMYYGNPSVYVSSENAAGVWDSNYQAVWHLKETTSGTDAIKDSTGNARHGTDVGSPTLGATGQIDGAVDFGNPNTTRRIDTKDFMSSGVTQFTAEAWVYKAATKDARIIYKNNVGNTGNPVFGLASGGSDTIRCRLRISDGSGTDYNVGTISLNTWTHVACTYDGSNVRAYKNGQEAGFVGETGTLAATNDVVVIAQNEAGTSADRHWPGVIDEVRVSSIARDDCWLETEFANQNNPSVFYSVGAEEGSPATAVDLVSFTAKGKGSTVLVEWETAQELNHMGFHLYRARSPWGPFTRLTDKLISGLSSSVVGRAYSFEDKDVTPGELYFYRLEDIDIYGKKTLHGPISVDWDGDGLPDDWEIAHGLNPNSNDAHLDLDGDG